MKSLDAISDLKLISRGLKETVDAAPTFPQVLLKLETWLDRHSLRHGDELSGDAIWVTDGVRFSSHLLPSYLTLFQLALGPTVC